MDRFDEETIRKAYRLHQQLMVKGKVGRKRNPELYRHYLDHSVRFLLHHVFLVEAKAEVLREDEVLYFVPEMDNDLFAYRNEDLREQIGVENNNQLYLMQFIYMHVIGEFYGEQYQAIKEPRSFITLEEVFKKVKKGIEKFMQIDEDTLHELSHDHDLNLIGMIGAWEGLTQETEDIKDLRKAPKRFRGFFIKALRFWENEGLILVQDDGDIYLTEKMKGIAGGYYNQSDRISKIKELLQDNEINGGTTYA